jgi:hypothetical protein
MLDVRAISTLSAVLLACAALTPHPAKADPLYDLTLGSIRGTVADNGTSDGAFTQAPGFLAFGDMILAPTDPWNIYLSPSLIDPTAVSTTTLDYTSGTGGLAEQPITVAVFVPDPNNPTTPAFYTMTGSVSLTGTFTNTGTGSSFTFLMLCVDPNNANLVDEYQATGIDTAGGAGNGIDSWADSFVFRVGYNEPANTSEVITGRTSGGNAMLVPEPGSACVLGAGLAAFLVTRRRGRTI